MIAGPYLATLAPRNRADSPFGRSTGWHSGRRGLCRVKADSYARRVMSRIRGCRLTCAFVFARAWDVTDARRPSAPGLLRRTMLGPPPGTAPLPAKCHPVDLAQPDRAAARGPFVFICWAPGVALPTPGSRTRDMSPCAL